MNTEQNARATHAEVTRLRVRLESLCASAMLGLPVSSEDIFELMNMARLSNHHSARSISRGPATDRRDETRLPSFDGVEDAQQAVLPNDRAVAAAVSAAVSAEIRRALIEGASS